MAQQAEIGIFGGSGFYEYAESPIEEVKIETPYGPPSDKVSLSVVGGRKVAFLARHGKDHSIPPHKINCRANLWAFKELGVTRIIAPNAVGSLHARYKPGDFAINDQFVDRTSGRMDTFYDGPVVTHVSTAEPYCPELRRIAIEASNTEGVTVHETATCVIIQGPRFSTKAESRWFSQAGWEIINMTQYPEVALARELAMCYVNISLITDYDAGVVIESGAHVEATDVMQVIAQNTRNVRRVIKQVIDTLPHARGCPCGAALDHARLIQ